MDKTEFLLLIQQIWRSDDKRPNEVKQKEASDLLDEYLKDIGFEPPVSGRDSKNESLDKLAEQLFVALIANPERYKYITNKFEEMKIGGKTNAHKILTKKNINKAYKLAEAFLNYER